MATMLLAREVPPVGGDTMFCDAYAMYEGLPPNVQKQCQGLTALHVGAPHHGVWTCEHPVLRTHPETGGTTLNVSPGFTRSIIGLSQEESEKLLSKLHRQAGAPEYTCRFRWENGSLAFYDNRSCQHCAVADFWPHSRKLDRITLLDKEYPREPYYVSPSGAKVHGSEQIHGGGGIEYRRQAKI